jgi:hypothetical protein
MASNTPLEAMLSVSRGFEITFVEFWPNGRWGKGMDQSYASHAALQHK